MAIGFQTFTNSGIKQLDESNFSAMLVDKAPRYISGTNGRTTQYTGSGSSTASVVIGDYLGVSGFPASSIHKEAGEFVAISFPSTGRAVGWSSIPTPIGFSDDYYFPFICSGTSDPALSGYIFNKAITSTGIGLVMYNESDNLIYTSNQNTIRVVGILDVRPENIGISLSVDSSRVYAALFLQNNRFPPRVGNTLKYYGVENSGSSIYVRHILDQPVPSYHLAPPVSSYMNQVAIIDVTGY